MATNVLIAANLFSFVSECALSSMRQPCISEATHCIRLGSGLQENSKLKIIRGANML